jgi:predicted Zn-dependent peptidase
VQYEDVSDFRQQPSNAQLLGAKASDLQAKVRGLLDTKHKVAYFGPRRLEDVKALLTLGDGSKSPKTRKPKSMRDVRQTTIYVIDKDVAKATVAVTTPAGVRPDDDMAEAELVGEYLGGGMGGAFFQEIREARGLAYFAGAYFTTGGRKGDEWALGGEMQTQVDKTVEALALMLELLERPVDPTRLEDAKQARDQSFRTSRVSPRWITGYVGYWIDRGFSSDPRPAVWKETKELDPAKLNAFLADVTKTPKLIALTADTKKLDMAALAKLGKIVKVKPEQLVSWGAFPKTKGAGKAKAKAKAETPARAP